MLDTREKLLSVARDVLHRIDSGATRSASSTLSIDAAAYVDPEVHAVDCRQIFRRIPLVLAASCELPEAGTYKSIDVAGISVLLVRDRSNEVRAYLNSCPHRGAQLKSGGGATSRITCPYHAWTFSLSGKLMAVPLQTEFGALDMSAHELLAFPVYESAGLVWVTLDPESTLSTVRFLQGFDYLLQPLNLSAWHLLKQTALPGPNWKLAFEAHLEFYHLPVLHGQTFGPGISNQALHYFWGPHQRLIQPSYEHKEIPAYANLFLEREKPEAQWSDLALMLGEWIIFPNVSLNIFFDGGLGVILSQVLPGLDVNESVTVQTYLTADIPEGEDARPANQLADFLAHVVGSEDLPMSQGQARNLTNGFQQNVIVGGNEAGIQHFHAWLDRLSNASCTPEQLVDYPADWAAPQ